MPSPFPGMDPYLEDPAFWSDFHARFLTYLSDAINERLPDNYEARIDRDPFAPGTSPSGGGTATIEAVRIPLTRRRVRRKKYLKILKRPDRELVTVIELLSPSNKVGEGRGDYLAKREQLLDQGVNLFELDLLRDGRRIPLGKPLPVGDYFALVARGSDPTICDVYPWTVRDPLPTLPIPLKVPDPDVSVDLGAVFITAYEKGRYDRVLPRDEPPSGLLRPGDLAWVLERAGRRLGGPRASG